MNIQSKDLKLFFPTPIWTSVLPNYKDINKKIYEYIKTLKMKDPDGLVKSNFLGWHSKDFLLTDNQINEFINNIFPKIENAIDDLGWDKQKNNIKITSMWSIINNKAASNGRHIHANNYISAAYYVKAPLNCGDIVFYDPRDAKTIRKPILTKPNQLNSEVVSVVPQEGLLVLFPSYLHHSVNPNISENERVVVSFNINLS